MNVNYSEGNNLLDGGDGNDYLSASGNYYYNVRAGLIFLNPIPGNNTLTGGAGDDNLNADYSTGNNTLTGGAGDDNLNADYSTGNNTLTGGAGDDNLSVSGFTTGRFGDSYRSYGTGNNTLNGDAGDDSFNASYTTGNNTLNGGIGDDYFNLDNSTGNNLIFGGDGNDLFYINTLYTAPSSLVTQTLDGGKGDDLLSVDYSRSSGGITTTFNATTNIGSITADTNRVNYKFIERLNIKGTFYDDNIVGNSGNDTLSTGNGGKDTIDGGKGDDVLSVDYGNSSAGVTTTFNATTNIGSITADTNRVNYKFIERLNIQGTAYDDNIVGNSGNDTLSTGNGGKDTIDGGKGDDVLSVDYGNSSGGMTTTFNASTNIGAITAGTNRVNYKFIERLEIKGTTYDDNIVGNSGNDTLFGGYGGKDTIDGGKGDDYLSGSYSSGNQTFYGGFGNDYLTGGNGNDSLYGGSGTDTFTFNSYDGGIDSIYDFNATNELIKVVVYGFGGGLSSGSLKASQFIIGTSANTSVQRFIYNSATGELFFDQDGSASGFTQVKFAQLSGGLSLTENNFVAFYS
ncbi:calcium-binding protein [Nostoc sp. CHAB 5824]|nr:calcium-binding protein [Nostoc sp. CHAB 5824]